LRRAEALGGEIFQVSFNTVPKSQDEENRRTPYVFISRNCEFPEPATIEWHDGQDYDGGAEIVAVNLRRNRISIKLDRPMEITVGFNVLDNQFAELISFLTKIFGNGFYLDNSPHGSGHGEEYRSNGKGSPKFIH